MSWVGKADEHAIEPFGACPRQLPLLWGAAGDRDQRFRVEPSDINYTLSRLLIIPYIIYISERV